MTPLRCKRAQMFLGGIRRLEAEGARDFRARRRHAALGDGVLNEPQDLRLAWGQIRHSAPVYVTSMVLYTVSDAGKRAAARYCWQADDRSPPHAPDS